MIVKYINAETNWVNIQNITKATMKKVDKKTKNIPYDFVVELYDNQICEIIDVYVKTYESGVELINYLYEFGRVDLTTNRDVLIIVESLTTFDILGMNFGDDSDLDDLGAEGILL